MLALLGAFGICFILRGAFMFAGRGIPKGVLERLRIKNSLGAGTEVQAAYIFCGEFVLCCCGVQIPFLRFPFMR